MKKASPREEASQQSHDNNTTAQRRRLLDEATEALYFIPADIPRPDWAKIAMTCKSADFPFEVFDQWSSTGQSYDPKAARDTWKSISPDGGISIKTLFHIAKQYGYDPRQSKADFKPLIELAKQRQQKAEKARQEATEKAGARANNLLNNCGYAPANHPYFVSKGVRPPIPVWQYKQAIVIPVMDLQGEVHSLQFIQPDGKKTFLKDGAIKGHFYQLWSRKKPSDAIVICEGYATACTLVCHYTPNCGVIAAFNAGNLKPVAQVFRKAFPDAHIVIAGDTDKSSIGQKAAFDAAQAVAGDVALPVFADNEAGSDWNDRWLLDHKGAA